ncbi:hypothetical protein BDN72DRAFT_587869 [Pluteus cervinus]|uniref:Uncharacterized protein n=1 Tax=Pluteus cervinus TaxID=181527 RepID=A0ACD3AUY4_9AGAR|nr:hypothetical protein BDN72DRAFT_587869 [Pluteus cervinus]
MPRTTKQKAVKAEAEDLHRLPSLSQESVATIASEENDSEIREMLKQHYKSAHEKKQKEKVKKFLETGQRDLSHLISSTTSNLAICISSMDEDFVQFTLEYAAYEDRIRELWALILEKQRTLHDLANELQARGVAESEKASSSQIAALSQMRTACQDHQEVIEREFQVEI